MTNFRITLLALASFLLVTSCNNGLKENEFSINVNLSGLNEGKELVLQQRTKDGYEVTDTAEVVKDGFLFKNILEHPKLVYITSSGFRGAIPVFVEAGEIQVTASIDSINKAVVTGSNAHDFFTAINQELANIDKIWQDYYFNTFRSMSKEDQALNEEKINNLYDSAQVLKANYLETELLKNGNQPAIPTLVLSNIDAMNIDAVQAIYDNLSPEILDADDAENLAERIAIIKRTDIGQPLIDFTMNDTLGNPITLSEYAAGKYVLVDFWAAWCAPCRGENPNVLANYKKYNKKGFTVFGVSFDKNKENWIKAINDDGLIWGQVSDLQFWNNAAGKLYGVRSIPQNILLDPNGIIIEKNLRGAALGKKLEELLGK
ncbi:MAG: hypothetical protein DRI74_08630 [Bacteroidetes bacterium]|nr:MAG: hypothetical protein DRI74_08630 [Bacteroidota bacterium]